MNRRHWIYALLFLGVFFYLFFALKGSSPFENKVKLSLVLEPGIMNVSDVNEETLEITARAENKTSEDYPKGEYFYRILIGKGRPYSPAIVLREFSKDLKKGKSLVIPASWERSEYLTQGYTRLKVYFNLYKKNGKNDPIIVASTMKFLYLYSSIASQKLFPYCYYTPAEVVYE